MVCHWFPKLLPPHDEVAGFVAGKAFKRRSRHIFRTVGERRPRVSPATTIRWPELWGWRETNVGLLPDEGSWPSRAGSFPGGAPSSSGLARNVAANCLRK